MEFKVVDVPQVPVHGAMAPIISALQLNLGKALELPLEDRDANTFRKNIRASLVNRKMLEKFFFRTQVDMVRKVMVVWLEAKPETK